MAKKFEIFISYRRKGGYDTAKLLYDRLRLDGYSISFDIDTLEKGDFDDELENRVKVCKDFLLVLNPGVFDRFFDPECDPKDDWVRREIALALEENKNIVPLFLDEFVFPKQLLPQDVKDITRKNGIDLNPKHFESAYADLKQKFLISQPHWATKYKKKIIAALSLVFLAIAVCLYFAITGNISEKEQEFELAKRQLADSVAREMRIKDSIIKYKDSVTNAKQQLQAQQQQQQMQQQSQSPPQSKPQPASSGAADKKPVASSSKSLHWVSSNDKIGNIIYEKLASAGIQKAECSGNGIKISAEPLKKAACKQGQLGEVTCLYSPKLKLTDCNGASISSLEMPQMKSEGADESKARKEMEKKLDETDFSQWVSKIKSMK